MVTESPTYSGWQKWQPPIQGFDFAACGKVCKYMCFLLYTFLTIAIVIITINFLCFAGRILCAPKARPVLVNGAVRKGERLIPPPAFEILIRVTFPPASTRVKVDVQLALLFLYLNVS